MTLTKEKIQTHLTNLYPNDNVEEIYQSIQKRIESFRKSQNLTAIITGCRPVFSERDIVLICYADHLKRKDKNYLQSLYSFLDDHLRGLVNSIHILPFYPYSSDDGFSIINFREVSPQFGDWNDIDTISSHYQLMVDFVVNHVSIKNPWFQKYLLDNPAYSDFFIRGDNQSDLSMVVRPRSTPLLTHFDTAHGPEQIWTTFSDDQVDLNHANPKVLLEMVDVLLFYIQKEVKIIRLDAVSYLWKAIGTSCINLPQTHTYVKLLRLILDLAAPEVALVTETNVPHEENIEYFGNYMPEHQYSDEAQVVYQFPLAPLILFTFLAGNVAKLHKWIESLPSLPDGTTFLNFMASHDGIGIRPVENILTGEEISAVIDSVASHGGRVSSKTDTTGGESVYELNSTWYDALNDPRAPSDDVDIERFLASQIIMLSLSGIAGIYFSSLFGARNCQTCLEETGRNRSINRKKYLWEDLEAMLKDPSNPHGRIFTRYQRILILRSSYSAFNPAAAMSVLDLNPGVFSILRESITGKRLICLVNISAQKQSVEIPIQVTENRGSSVWRDLISGQAFNTTNRHLSLQLAPYQYYWLVPARSNCNTR